MYRSSWDVEVFARDMQERRMREVTKARQIAEAELGATSMRPRRRDAAISAIAATVRGWLAPAEWIRREILGRPLRPPVVSEMSTE